MSAPNVHELGNTFNFEWEPEKVIARVERVYQHTRGDVSAEITFRTTNTDPPALLHHTMCSNLLGPRSRQPIAKDCASKYPHIDEKQWLAMIETCFEYVVVRSREGEPPEFLVDVDINEETDFLLYPLLHRGHITVLFGLGGSLKSTITAWLSHRVALGIDCDAVNVGILDWESTKQSWARRLKEVAGGMAHRQGDDGYLTPEIAPNITYRRMAMPIADDIEAVYRMGTDRDIGLWILDSAMWACGGRPEEAEHAMRMFRAVRSLGGSCLVIAHQNNDENTKRPYGNVMWVNAPRSVIQVQKGEYTTAENEVVVGLTQRKVNYGKPFPPMGFRALFNQQDEHGYTPGDYLIVEATNPLDEEDLAENVSMPLRISHLLRHGRMTKPDLYEALNVMDPKRIKTVSSTIDRMVRDGKLEKLVDGTIGLAAGTFPPGGSSNGNGVSTNNGVIAFPSGG